MVDLAIINNFATDDKRYTEGISHGLSHIVRSEGNAGTLLYASNTPAPNRARIWRSTKSASHIINHRSFSLHFATVLDDMQAERSEEQTYELQSLMRNSYAVFCLKNTNTHTTINTRFSKQRNNKQLLTKSI